MHNESIAQIIESSKNFHTEKGLYWLDFKRIVQSWPMLVVITLAVCFGLWMADSLVGLICFFAIMLMMQAPSSIVADKSCGWFDFEPSLPITRKKLVSQKYTLALILMLAGLLIGLAMAYLLAGIKTGSFQFEESALQINLLISVVIGCSCAALILPLGFLVDKDKFFLCVILSFLPAVLMVYLWTQGISVSEPVLTSGVAGVQSSFVEVNLNLDTLRLYAGISLAMLIVSWLVMPGFLARRDNL